MDTVIPAADPKTELIRKYDVDFELLPEGTRIRSVAHPELTGVIKHYEWNKPGLLSAIPYCIGWDDSQAAHDELGLFFVYASVKGVERDPDL